MSLRDPRMAQKNAETMALYKENGANPMGGCLPMLVQMPFLFAFYKVLAVSISMRDASWLWVGDLSQPEHLAIRILPIIMIATSFLMQRMTPTTGMDPSQQRMMMFMPLIMGFFFYNQSSGLVLYWLTGNLMGIAQQYFFNKTIVPAQPVPVVEGFRPRASPVRRSRAANNTLHDGGSALSEIKYSVETTGPKIDAFLRQMIQRRAVRS